MRTVVRQKNRIVLTLLVLAITLLQPMPEARADVSAQDKEVLEAVDKVAPTVEKIAKKLWDLFEVSLLEATKTGDPITILEDDTVEVG